MAMSRKPDNLADSELVDPHYYEHIDEYNGFESLDGPDVIDLGQESDISIENLELEDAKARQRQRNENKRVLPNDWQDFEPNDWQEEPGVWDTDDPYS